MVDLEPAAPRLIGRDQTDVGFAGLHQIVDPLSDDLRHIPRPARRSHPTDAGTQASHESGQA